MTEEKPDYDDPTEYCHSCDPDEDGTRSKVRKFCDECAAGLCDECIEPHGDMCIESTE